MQPGIRLAKCGLRPSFHSGPGQKPVWRPPASSSKFTRGVSAVLLGDPHRGRPLSHGPSLHDRSIGSGSPERVGDVRLRHRVRRKQACRACHAILQGARGGCLRQSTHGVQSPVATDWVVMRWTSAPGALPAPRAARCRSHGRRNHLHHASPGRCGEENAGRCPRWRHDLRFRLRGGSSGSALFDINGRLVGGPLSNGAGCSVSYAPVAPIKSALANPPVPAAALDVMVVFDKSGSSSTAPPRRSGRTKLAEAQDAASLFVQLVREGQGDRLGLVTFNSTGSLDAVLLSRRPRSRRWSVPLPSHQGRSERSPPEAARASVPA